MRTENVWMLCFLSRYQNNSHSSLSSEYQLRVIGALVVSVVYERTGGPHSVHLLHRKQHLWKNFPSHCTSSAKYTVFRQQPHLFPPPKGILRSHSGDLVPYIEEEQQVCTSCVLTLTQWE